MKCPDCDQEHAVTEAEHNLVCEARSCCLCLNNFPEPVPMDDAGERVCRTCRVDIAGGGEWADSEEESEIEED
jgi:hypothetical protein